MIGQFGYIEREWDEKEKEWKLNVFSGTQDNTIRTVYYSPDWLEEIIEENAKLKQFAESVKDIIKDHNCRGFGCINCESLKQLIEELK